MKRIAVILALFVPVFLFAQNSRTTIDEKRAADIAIGFYNQHNPQKAVLHDDGITLVQSNPYVFDIESGKGFVVVANNESDQPILAFSFENRFDGNIPAVRDWIASYRHHSSGKSTPDGHRSLQPKNDGVSPMMTTEWGQEPFYNEMCPIDASTGDTTTAGSVITAMAQVMRYWQHPKVGTGSNSYADPDHGTQSAHFDSTIYRWHAMPAQLDVNSSPYQRQSVAKLVYHCAVASGTYFFTAAQGGGATFVTSYGIEDLDCAENAFKRYFKYKSTISGLRRSTFSDQQWADTIKSELDAGRPVIYTSYHEYTSFSHAFVCDGYTFIDEQTMFHFNWGWNGTSNGFYSLENLSPTLDSVTYHFISSQNAIVGIEPDYTIPDDTTTVDTIVVGIPSQNTAYEAQQLTILPNPATEHVTLTATQPFETVNIFDAKGHLMGTRRTSPTKQLTLDISHLPSGIYFLQVVKKGEKHYKKIIRL